MRNINIDFSRAMLAGVMEDVRAVTTVAERKAAWVYHFGGGHWEFHGPDGYYWHGEADSAYDARAKGWAQWFDRIGQARRDRAA